MNVAVLFGPEPVGVPFGGSSRRPNECGGQSNTSWMSGVKLCMVSSFSVGPSAYQRLDPVAGCPDVRELKGFECRCTTVASGVGEKATQSTRKIIVKLVHNATASDRSYQVIRCPVLPVSYKVTRCRELNRELVLSSSVLLRVSGEEQCRFIAIMAEGRT